MVAPSASLPSREAAWPWSVLTNISVVTLSKSRRASGLRLSAAGAAPCSTFSAAIDLRCSCTPAKALIFISSSAQPPSTSMRTEPSKTASAAEISSRSFSLSAIISAFCISTSLCSESACVTSCSICSCKATFASNSTRAASSLAAASARAAFFSFSWISADCTPSVQVAFFSCAQRCVARRASWARRAKSAWNSWRAPTGTTAC
mmetsp:Transcript_8213/g.17434  ORF Transcript_8213/g.17434 Transcript_8213/m.17434 type:complete len:205 (-) Transcript_8213:168-782(-)